MIHMIFSRKDLIRGSFALERLEAKYGYSLTSEAAEALAGALNTDAYLKWADRKLRDNTFAYEVHLYPELLSEWERDILAEAYATVPELANSPQDFRDSAEYIQYYVVSLEQRVRLTD